jgi:endonuclease YncB( thermonuclease family)
LAYYRVSTVRQGQSGLCRDAQRLTIRLACIDAPETAQRPYGAASRQRLQMLAPVGATVTIRPQTRDRYGRTVAEVFRHGVSINLAMVRGGHAFAYRKYLAACDGNGSAYLAAEAAAQRERLGVWAVPGGITRPWDFRRGPADAAALSAGATTRNHYPAFILMQACWPTSNCSSPPSARSSGATGSASGIFSIART